MTKILLAIYLAILVSLFFVGCFDSTKPEPDTTTLKLTSPAGGSAFKIGDTVTISIAANGDSVSKVGVSVTSNGGKHYMPIAAKEIAISGSGVKMYTQQWIVGREMYGADFTKLYADTMFGSAANPHPSWECRIRLTGTGMVDTVVESETFTVSLKMPYYLRHPSGGETFRFTDTIPVIYIFRDDSMSNITYHYWSIQEIEWDQVDNLAITSHRGENDRHCVTLKRRFIPSHPNNIKPIGDSTKIRINDYSLDRPKDSGFFRIVK